MLFLVYAWTSLKRSFQSTRNRQQEIQPIPQRGIYMAAKVGKQSKGHPGQHSDPGASRGRGSEWLPKHRRLAACAGDVPLCHVMVSGSISSLANLFISSSVSVVGSVFSMPNLWEKKKKKEKRKSKHKMRQEQAQAAEANRSLRFEAVWSTQRVVSYSQTLSQQNKTKIRRELSFVRPSISWLWTWCHQLLQVPVVLPYDDGLNSEL